MPNRHETLTSLFDDIADAIREKTGSNELIKADNFDTAISEIQTSGGGSDDYFWIEPIEANCTCQIATTGSSNAIELQYSTDKTTWVNIAKNEQINVEKNVKYYFKNNNSLWSIDTSNYLTWKVTNKYNVGGRINSLINDIDGKGCPINCFNRLFYNQTNLVDASALKLNAIVSSSCYRNMFDGCTNLTTPPQLPATFTRQYCYAYMFNGCTSLTTAPALPATTFIDDSSYCYQKMFYGCTSLTTAPSLPCTNLKQYCYNDMFKNCTSLTTVPQLPAKSLAANCYNGMFDGCTSLKVYAESGEGHAKAWNIPSNEAISGTTRSQSNMFNGVQTDAVPATFPGTSGQQFTYYTQNDPV